MGNSISSLPPKKKKKCTPLLQHRANGSHQDILVSRTLHLPTWLTEMMDLYEFSGYARATAGARYDWFMSMFTKAWINLEGFTITFVPPTLAPSSSDTLAVEFLASRFRGPETKWHPRTYPSSTGLRHPAAPKRYYLLKPCCHNKIAGRSTVHYLTSCDWLEWDQNLPHSLGSFRYIGVRHSHGTTELSPLPSTQPLFPKLMRVRIKQMICTSSQYSDQQVVHTLCHPCLSFIDRTVKLSIRYALLNYRPRRGLCFEVYATLSPLSARRCMRRKRIG